MPTHHKAIDSSDLLVNEHPSSLQRSSGRVSLIWSTLLTQIIWTMCGACMLPPPPSLSRTVDRVPYSPLACFPCHLSQPPPDHITGNFTGVQHCDHEIQRTPVHVWVGSESIEPWCCSIIDGAEDTLGLIYSDQRIFGTITWNSMYSMLHIEIIMFVVNVTLLLYGNFRMHPVIQMLNGEYTSDLFACDSMTSLRNR